MEPQACGNPLWMGKGETLGKLIRIGHLGPKGQVLRAQIATAGGGTQMTIAGIDGVCAVHRAD
ncbi:hypothetical protein [Oricola sp.]|uniref:hypothetical protein n=1 Tax=Oricola sp. TaxID=1979950 RepID=UPI003BA91A94